MIAAGYLMHDCDRRAIFVGRQVALVIAACSLCRTRHTSARGSVGLSSVVIVRAIETRLGSASQTHRTSSQRAGRDQNDGKVRRRSDRTTILAVVSALTLSTSGAISRNATSLDG